MDYGLTKKVVVVTGASSGIGLATAQLLVSEGANIVVADLNAPPAGALPVDVSLIVPGDLTDPAYPAGVALSALGRFGRIDALVNCAGRTGQRLGLLDMDEEDLWKTVSVNFTSAFRMSRAVLPAIIDAGGGSIVHVASDTARMPDPSRYDYALSKLMLFSLSKNISIEFGPRGVRSNVVSPGPVRTAMWDKPGGTVDHLVGLYGTSPDEAVARFVKEVRRMPIGRTGRPEEIGAVIAFLLSDQAAFVTGAEFRADGGSIPLVA